MKLQYLSQIERQNYKTKAKIKEIRAEIRSLSLKSMKIDYEMLIVPLNKPAHPKNIMVSKNPSKLGLLPILIKPGGRENPELLMIDIP